MLISSANQTVALPFSEIPIGVYAIYYHLAVMHCLFGFGWMQTQPRHSLRRGYIGTRAHKSMATPQLSPLSRKHHINKKRWLSLANTTTVFQEEFSDVRVNAQNHHHDRYRYFCFTPYTFFSSAKHTPHSQNPFYSLSKQMGKHARLTLQSRFPCGKLFIIFLGRNAKIALYVAPKPVIYNPLF